MTGDGNAVLLQITFQFSGMMFDSITVGVSLLDYRYFFDTLSLDTKSVHASHTFQSSFSRQSTLRLSECEM